MADETRRVKMGVAMGGPDVSYAYGREYDLPVALAEAFCADGRATAVESEPVVPAGAGDTEPNPAAVGAERKAADAERKRKARAAKKDRGERTGSGPAGGAETREG